MRDTLRSTATRAGLEVIDMAPIFAADYARNHQPFEFPTDGHWNARGHARAAEAIKGSAVWRQFLSEPAR